MSKLKENLPLLSALLIFIGYLNSRFYYVHFDINIETYLTTTELIFSFLPLTIPFLLTLTAILFWAIGFRLVFGGSINPIDNSEPTSLEQIATAATAWSDLRDYFKESKRKVSFWLGVPIVLIVFLLRITVQIFMVVYAFLFLVNVFKEEPEGFLRTGFWPLLIFGIIWLVFLFIKADKEKTEERRLRNRVMTNILVITIAVGLLKLSNQENAREVLKGSGEFSARLQLGDTTIETDSTTVFVGQTSNFIFLRDLPSQENIIYKIDDITSLKLKRLE